MIGLDGALLALIGIVVGSLLGQRGARRVAGEDRLWARKADLYLELLDWLADDLREHEAGRPVLVSRHQGLLIRLQAFGTDRLDRTLAEYISMRQGAFEPASLGHVEAIVGGARVRILVRNELAALPSRGDSAAVALLGRRPIRGLVARWRMRLDRAQQGTES